MGTERDMTWAGDARLVRMTESVVFPWLAQQEELLVGALCQKLKEGTCDAIAVARVSAIRDLRMSLVGVMRKGESAAERLNKEF